MKFIPAFLLSLVILSGCECQPVRVTLNGQPAAVIEGDRIVDRDPATGRFVSLHINREVALPAKQPKP